jgi:hypothetical protein
MHVYEFRILSARHPIAVIEETHFSDHAAVRSAKKFAAGRPFEVWRDLDCVYAVPKSYTSRKTGQSPFL